MSYAHNRDRTDAMSQTIYIDGVAHRCTDITTGAFYADHPSLPGRYCSQHRIGEQAARHLLNGGGIHTSGHDYTLLPPTPEPVPENGMKDEDDTPPDVWDTITSYVAYGIGALMALVLFAMALGYVWGSI